MRIGILTLPLHTNYGGILQTYALQTVLEEMGHEVKVIHKNPILKEPTFGEYLCRFFQKKILGRDVFITAERWANQVTPIIRKNIDEFIAKNIHCYTVDSLQQVKERDFDAIVVGSDQIWRASYFTKAWDSTELNCFLSFAKEWKVKKIVYAASFGKDAWEFSDTLTDEIGNLLTLFDAISVREESGSEILYRKFNIKASHLLDPTLLLSSQDYDKLIETSLESKNNHFLFCYILDMDENKKEIVNKIAEDKSLTPFFISFSSSYTSPKECQPIPSVESWLRGFRDSDFVVTDSFHACVFSILYNKPFVVIGNVERGMSRMESILKTFDLSPNLIKDISGYNSFANYDIPSKTKLILQDKRQESMNYLNAHLICQ